MISQIGKTPIRDEANAEIQERSQYLRKLDTMVETASAELSEEELGKVAGGATPTVIISYITIVSVATIATKISYDTLVK